MKFGKKGFTMVELLVVLLIIGILAAVAAPLYLANAKRAKVSEAVATMSLIRQAERDWFVNHNGYFSITGNIANPLPISVDAAGVPNPGTAGVDVNASVAQYFSNAAYSVTLDPTDGTMFTNPAPVNFLIVVNGANSVPCVGAGANNCAVHNTDVALFRLKMDNSGRTFVSYDTGTTWTAY